MYRLAAILLAVFLATHATASARAEEAASSNQRVILLYVVTPPDENARSGMKSWRQLFDNNIRYLLATASPEASRSIKVVVAWENVDEMNQDNLEASFWRQPSLQVLTAVGTYADQATFVDNQVFLGDLKGSLAIPFVQLSHRVQPGQYKIAREALAAVTLYAYAMAIEKVLPPERSRFPVCQVLDRANMYKDADIGSDAREALRSLFRAIAAELEARACGGRL